MTKGYKVLSLDSVKPSKGTVSKFDLDTQSTAQKERELKNISDDEIIERLRTRFQILDDMTRAVKKGDVRAMIVTGPPGVGKSFGVEEVLSKDDLFDVMGQRKPKYEIVKGAMSAIGLYSKLYKFSDAKNILVFDDCDSILKDPTAINLLKAALDSYSKRIVCWQSEVKGSDLPTSFVFNGGVIFISNYTLGTLDPAVRTRALCVDLSMTADQKLERMEQILRDARIATLYEVSMKLEALGAIRENLSKVKNLSLRTLKQVIDVRKGNRKGWAKLALYVMSQ